MRMRRVAVAMGLAFLVVATAPATGRASPEKWHASALGGGELNFAPGVDNQLGGHGWFGFDSVGKGIVGGGDLHLFFNTTKAHAAA